MKSLRLAGETDEELRARAERAAKYASLLVEAALQNLEIQELISDPQWPTWTEQSQRVNPTARIEYEQAICIAGVGEGLAATKNKSWGDGPQIVPVRPDDPVNPMYVTYVYRENSIYNRRFLQRRKLKQLLGKSYRRLVRQACRKFSTKKLFLAKLTVDERRAFERLLHLTPAEFYRAARGRQFFTKLPAENQQTLSLDIDEDCVDHRPPEPDQTYTDFFNMAGKRSCRNATGHQLVLPFCDQD